MTIFLGADHAGFALRRVLADWLIGRGYAVAEFGATGEAPHDYPDAAYLVADGVASGKASLGVLICGTGIGVSIAANKVEGIRAAVCWNEESAKLAREHNHANIICLGARLISPDSAVNCLDAFLNTEPSTEPRHIRRVEKLNARCAAGETVGC